MTIRIGPVASHDAPEIAAFNERLRAAHVEFQLPEIHSLLPPSGDGGVPVWHEMFVAKEGSTVRGGYLLKRELLVRSQDPLELWNYQIPLSEGIVSRAYAMVGIQILQDAMRRQAHLYSLGMGSMRRPLPKLLARFSWRVEPVPFLFRVIRGNAFLRNITYLKQQKSGRALTQLARLSGAGSLATAGWRAVARIRMPRIPPGITLETVSSFGQEADTLMEKERHGYPALIDRGAAALNIRFPRTDHRLIRIIAREGRSPIGWLVLTCSDLRDHKQFGSMRLGCIVDGLCAPELCPSLLRLGTELLISKRVDLIVSNQSHHAWTAGLRHCGYLSGPSNYIFARSPALAAITPEVTGWHINRGDGDGPINL